MKTYSVTIKGTTAYLQHRFSEENQAEKTTRRVQVVRGTPRDEAEKVCYRDKDGVLYFPGAAIGRLLREAGGGHKQRGSRKSCKFVIPAAVLVLDEAVRFHRVADSTDPIRDYEVDSRPVTIPSTKGRIMRHRPRIDEWAATFNIRINENILPPDFVQQLLAEGGQQIGIGDYRPEKGGPFGTFIVVEWKEIA